MACVSTLHRRFDKNGKLIGLSLGCSGNCREGKCEKTGRPDPEGDEDVTIEFCACPEDIVPRPWDRKGLVRGCRVAIIRRKQKPVDWMCIGSCADGAKECVGVVTGTVPLADGGRQETVECQCIDAVEPLAGTGKSASGQIASRKTSRRRRSARA